MTEWTAWLCMSYLFGPPLIFTFLLRRFSPRPVAMSSDIRFTHWGCEPLQWLITRACCIRQKETPFCRCCDVGLALLCIDSKAWNLLPMNANNASRHCSSLESVSPCSYKLRLVLSDFRRTKCTRIGSQALADTPIFLRPSRGTALWCRGAFLN